MVGGGFVADAFGSADSFNRIARMSGYVVASLRCFPGILGKYDRSSSSPVSLHCYLPRVLFAKKDVLCKEYGASRGQANARTRDVITCPGRAATKDANLARFQTRNDLCTKPVNTLILLHACVREERRRNRIRLSGILHCSWTRVAPLACSFPGINRGAPPRSWRCRFFSSSSSRRTRVWRRRDRDR
jgi:hypothetical protein